MHGLAEADVVTVPRVGAPVPIQEPVGVGEAVCVGTVGRRRDRQRDFRQHLRFEDPLRADQRHALPLPLEPLGQDLPWQYLAVVRHLVLKEVEGRLADRSILLVGIHGFQVRPRQRGGLPQCGSHVPVNRTGASRPICPAIGRVALFPLGPTAVIFPSREREVGKDSRVLRADAGVSYEQDGRLVMRPGESSAIRSNLTHQLPWFGLFAVVTLGVACGNLLSNYVTSVVAQYQLESVLRSFQESTDRMLDEQREKTEAAQAQRHRERVADRRESERGKELARRCAEWQAANRDLDTYTTRTNMNKYCGAYREYLDTGEISRQ